MDEITRDMLISDVLLNHPDAVTVFEQHDLGCATCYASSLETLAAVASMHDVPLEDLLADLNALPKTTEE